MWPVILAYARVYAPYVVMPLAGVVGFIGNNHGEDHNITGEVMSNVSTAFVGYNIEDWVSDKHTPFKESTLDRREARRLKEDQDGVEGFKVPSTIFDKNVSPSLEKKS